MVVMTGYAKLISATKLNGYATYSVQIISDLTDFVSVLADKKLEDISPELTEQFTHRCDFDTIFDSWSEQDENPCTGVIYPLADYGQFDTVNATNFFISNLRPALFAKQYLDLIFADAGFSYDSDFLNSDYFKRLVIPYKDGAFEGKGFESVVNGGDCSEGWQFESEAVDNMAYYATPVEGLELFQCVQSGGDYYSASGMTYIAPVTSVYDVNVTLPSVYFTFTSPHIVTNAWNTPLRIWIIYSVYSADESSHVMAAKYAVKYNTGDLMKSPVLPLAPLDYTTEVKEVTIPTQSIPMQEGERLKVSMYFASLYDSDHMISVFGLPGLYDPGTATMYTSKTIPPTLIIGLSKNFDNARITYSDFCLKNVKQIDFVSSIFKLFNLIPVPDRDRPGHFNILTSGQYYNNELSPLDWSDKIDYSQDVVITPIPSLQDGNLKLSYKDDSDYWTAYYKTLTGKTYGELTQETGYEFSSSTKDILQNNIFSACFPVVYNNEPIPCEVTCEIKNSNKYLFNITGYSEIEGTTLPTDKTFAHARVGVKIFYQGQTYTIDIVNNPLSFYVDREVTRTGGAVDSTFYAKADTFYYLTENDKQIIALYDSSDKNITRKPKAVNPRICYYQGLQDCNRYVVQLTPILIDRSYNYVSGSYLRYKDEYPIFSNVDNDTNPTRDLLFATPNPYFGLVQNYPVKNSPDFSNLLKEWENTFAEITQNDAKMLTAWVKLNPVDIATLDLTRRICIDGTYYRINAIKDYLPGKNTLTLCELVRCPDLVRYPVPVPPPDPACKSYSVKNYSAYVNTVNYYNCEGVLTTLSLAQFQLETICALEKTITGDQFIQVIDLGDCFTSECITYKVSNPMEEEVNMAYSDCYDTLHFLAVQPGASGETYVCALKNSIEWATGKTLQVLEVGECTPEYVDFKITNNSTDNTITGVSGVPGYTFGSSVGAGTSVTEDRGEVSASSAVISVVISGSGKKSLTLKTNGFFLDGISVNGSGTYSFSSHPIGAEDELEVILNDTDLYSAEVVIGVQHNNISAVGNIPGFTLGTTVTSGISPYSTTRPGTAFTASISVTCTATGERHLELWVNGNLVDHKDLDSSGTYSFTSRDYFNLDKIEIYLKDDYYA